MKATLKKFFVVGALISASYSLNGGSMTYYNSSGKKTTAESLLRPYCAIYEKSVRSLEEDFSSPRGAKKVVCSFADATSRVYDKKNFENSDKIRANVLYGIVGLAYEHEDNPGMKGVLSELTTDILSPEEGSEMNDVYARLGVEQKQSLEDIQQEVQDSIEES
jgi:hypothetical protein